ncbi:ParB N-terminal domain-containing protein [Bacteroides uniformis]|nr:ParB N-terminal domain-containing protein [Bacteroides uniformis]
MEEVSKYQKFETATINRGQIKNAEYNPRRISDSAKKKLKDNIKRVGLLDTIVVNKNTMNIVSGISVYLSLIRLKGKRTIT